MEEVRKRGPSTLTELMAVVEAFAESVDPEEVRRSARILDLESCQGLHSAGQLPAKASRAA